MDNKQIIQDRLDKIPQPIRDVIKNTDLAGKFNAIAKKHDLHIDQNGSLQNETVFVLLGLEPQKNYINNIQKELEVSREEAISIAEDVNKEIFASIRESLQEMQGAEEEQEQNVGEETPNEPSSNLTTEETPSQQIPLNKIPSDIPVTPAPAVSIPTPTPASTTPPQVNPISRFTPEKPPVGMVNPVVKEMNEAHADREDLIKEIENVTKPENAKPELPKTMVDHLLSNPVNIPQKIEEKREEDIGKIALAQKIPVKPVEKKPYATDPYREPIK